MSTALIPYTPPKTPMEFIKSEIEKRNPPKLPSELMLYIFSFLDVRSLSRCSLVDQRWKQLSSDRILWTNIFEKTDLSHVRTQRSFMSEAWRYRDLTLNFSGSNRFEPAIAACEKCAQLDAYNGAYGFRDLCKKACEVKDYKTAMKCQKLAKQYYADAGNEAMSFLIKSQVEDLNFLEHSEALIQLSVELIDEDREFGLQALITVAKKFADLQMFKEAMKYTQLGRTLRDSRHCSRRRNHNDDIHPFNEMGKHMLSLRQYKLSEECARKLDKQYHYPEEFYSDIIVKQIQEENFVNEALFSEIRPETKSWITASEGLVFGLIDNGRYDEAQKIAKSRLQATWGFRKHEFKHKLEKKLLSLGINAILWLG